MKIKLAVRIDTKCNHILLITCETGGPLVAAEYGAKLVESQMVCIFHGHFEIPREYRKHLKTIGTDENLKARADYVVRCYQSYLRSLPGYKDAELVISNRIQWRKAR